MTNAAYDLVVLGSGPAGEKGAAQAAYFGKRVALVEREPALGGAAANTGTLPSKTLRETALTLSGFRARGLYGVDLSLRRQATVKDFLHRERHVVDTERARVGANLDRHRVDTFTGPAAFVNPHTVSVGGTTLLKADVVLIATGSSPRRPAEFPADHPRVYDSDSILRLGDMPKRLIVVGAGVIGCEYACTFAALGVEVALVDGRDVLLPFLDRELSTALKEAIVRLGVKLVVNEKVKACRADAAGVALELGSGLKLEADAVLVAAGRTSNTGELALAAAGLATGERGLIEVDGHYRTKVPHIYAAGDVIGFPALASTSMEQARLAMVHAFDLKYKTDLAPVLPYGIYTIPEVAMAGETEESLKAKGVDYVAGRARYDQNARGIIIGDAHGFLKLLFRRDDLRLLGVHVIGEIASEISHIGLTALMTGAGADLFIRTCYNYPTLGDLYKYAAYDAMGRRTSAKC
ncbi:MAG TPA: Si-specific NAD(P)(+) transhydrogenase [Planctomycetota bacterium]